MKISMTKVLTRLQCDATLDSARTRGTVSVQCIGRAQLIS
jgi:hypothetical protein